MPNNINLDDLLRHQVTLSRLETSAYQSHIAPSLAQALRDIRRLLADAETITSRRQLNALEAEIKRVIRAESGWAAMQSELNQLADYDNRFFANLVGAGTVAASSERVKRMADNTMMIISRGSTQERTGLWPNFVRENQDSQISKVSALMRTAYSQGWDSRQMKRELNRRFKGEIAKNAETLARTATNHYSSVGRAAFAEANPDVITKEIPIVTFDSKTSQTCLSVAARYAQEGWDVGKSPIGRPPYHFNCRTVLGYLADGQDLVGTRAARGDSGKTSQIRAKTEIDSFVSRQSKAWQEDLLGTERARLFREGKLSLRNLTDASLRPLTLQQIAAREGIDI